MKVAPTVTRVQQICAECATSGRGVCSYLVNLSIHERIDTMSYGTLAWPLEHAGRVHADRAAVVDSERSWSYAEVRSEVARLGGALDALGVGAGERVAVLAGNTAEHLLCWLAVPAYGRVIVSLNHRLTVGELEFMLGDCACRVLVVDD